MWTQAFGTYEVPKHPWRHSFPDGCMYGARSPDEPPLALNKPYLVLSNFPMPLLNEQCRRGTRRFNVRERLDEDLGRVEAEVFLAKQHHAGPPCG